VEEPGTGYFSPGTPGRDLGLQQLRLHSNYRQCDIAASTDSRAESRRTSSPADGTRHGLQVRAVSLCIHQLHFESRQTRISGLRVARSGDLVITTWAQVKPARKWCSRCVDRLAA